MGWRAWPRLDQLINWEFWISWKISQNADKYRNIGDIAENLAKNLSTNYRCEISCWPNIGDILPKFRDISNHAWEHHSLGSSSNFPSLSFFQSISLSKVNLQHHLPKRALLIVDKSLISRPPFFLSFQIIDQFARWDVFLKSPSSPKEILLDFL